MTKEKSSREDRKLKQYAKDYLFNGVREEFGREIKRYAARTGLPDNITSLLAASSGLYLTELSRYRKKLHKASEVAAQIYQEIDTINLISHGSPAIWKPHDFVVTTPVNLQQRVLTAFEAEQARLKAEMNYLQKLYHAASDERREEFAREYEPLADKHNVLALNVGRDTLNLPGDIAIGAYELFLLRNLGLLRQDALKRYPESYKFFEDTIRELHAGEGKPPTHLYKARRSFLQKLKKHRRDIGAMATVIARELEYDHVEKCATNSYKAFVEPFYATDMTKMAFPSAQADFVAASLIALAKDK